MAFTDKFLCIYSSPFHLAMAQSKDGGLNTVIVVGLIISRVFYVYDFYFLVPLQVLVVLLHVVC